MQFFFIFTLPFFLSCQRDEVKTTATVQPEKVISLKDELGSFAFVSNIQDIEIKGDRISREGEITTGEDLKIIEKSSAKLVDEFLMKDWGKVGFKVHEKIVHAYPIKDTFEISYSVKDNKLTRQPSCVFTNVPDNSEYDLLLAEAMKANAHLERITGSLSDLARQGHKKSYEFLVSDDKSAQEIVKKTEDKGASITKVLRFMAKNGCVWQ